MGLAEAVAQVLERFGSLTFQGSPLRVFDDSNNVNPPCVWLPVPELEFVFHKGTMEVTWTAFLVAPAITALSVFPRPSLSSLTLWLARSPSWRPAHSP
jgi:hypothetical protein